jgi:hypothetical protein
MLPPATRAVALPGTRVTPGGDHDVPASPASRRHGRDEPSSGPGPPDARRRQPRRRVHPAPSPASLPNLKGRHGTAEMPKFLALPTKAPTIFVERQGARPCRSLRPTVLGPRRGPAGQSAIHRSVANRLRLGRIADVIGGLGRLILARRFMLRFVGTHIRGFPWKRLMSSPSGISAPAPATC